MAGFISDLLLNLQEHRHSTALLCSQDLNLIKATPVKFLPFYIPFPLFSAPAIRSLLYFHTTFLQQPILSVIVSHHSPGLFLGIQLEPQSIWSWLAGLKWAVSWWSTLPRSPGPWHPMALQAPTLDLLTLPLSCPSPAELLCCFQSPKEFWQHSSLCLSAEKNSVRAK